MMSLSIVIISMSGAISYLVYKSEIKTLEELVKDRLMSQIHHTMDKIDNIFIERYSDIKTFATDPVINSRNSTPEQINERLNKFIQNHNTFMSLSFYNLDRVRIADTSNKLIGTQHSLSGYWKKISEGKEVFIDISISESLGIPVVHAASVVRDREGMPFGVIVARIPVENLYKTITSVVGIYNIERDFKIEMISGNGLILYSSYDKEGILQKTSHHFQIIKPYLANSKTGTLRYTSTENEDEILAFATEPEHYVFKDDSWTLIAEVSSNVVFASANRLRDNIIITAVIIGVIFLILAYIFSRSVTMPIEELSNATHEIDKGNFDIEIKYKSEDEIGQLSSSFIKMAKTLKDYRSNISTYTAELEEALDKVKLLSGMLPICASCKKIRDDKGYWSQIETYIKSHSEAEFTHSLCPDCVQKLYPGLFKKE